VKKILLFLMLSFTAASSYSQDMELRSRAVALLERAHAVSVAPNLPDLERVDTFHLRGSKSKTPNTLYI
jgi:hypothetical protein